MKTSYLATVDAYGLRTIYREQKNTQHRLAQQLGCHNKPPSFMVWAVLDTETAVTLRNLIVSNRRAEAWLLLQHSAERLGRISLGPSPCSHRVTV